MLEQLRKSIDELALKKNLSPELVKTCLERAVEGAVCEFFEIRECDADVEDGIIMGYFHVGEDMGLSEAWWFYDWSFYGDVIPVEFTFMMFEEIPPVVERTRELFERIVEEVGADELVKKWRAKVHQAVEGVIKARHGDWIEVELGDEARGVMPRRRWVKRETASYRRGKLMYFYVVKVSKVVGGVDVELSRGSIGLPAALITHVAPWVKVKSVRRIAGRKSWVVADTRLPAAMLREVSRMLGGEVIEVNTGPA
ncbi:MAG: hypothetical protein DRH11_17585 [Deltaproteobacteria bacterium]|nr:MAG: hypothetical protein DRH11_17585 [Deltaproteobacteria bacterium]